MPRTGLNIPIITALDEAGELLDIDQRRIIRHTIHQGRGADSLFISGTTGEYNRLSNRRRQQLLQIGADEVRLVNEQLNVEPIQIWVGITAETKADTLSNLELAVALKADMAVIAPYAIGDLRPNEIADFFSREISAILPQSGAPEIGLYDNPDIAADFNARQNLPAEIIDELRKMPLVTCLKASATREVFRDYVGSFAALPASENFTLYAGNAGLIFEMPEIQREAKINAEKVLIAGVVSGTANVFPCEWQQAWQAVARGDTEKVSTYRRLFAEFEKLTGFPGENGYSSKLIGGIKQAMYHLGVISSPAVAPGTPQLTADEAAQLNEGLDNLLDKMKTELAADELSYNEVEASSSSIG